MTRSWTVARTRARRSVVLGISGLILITTFLLCALPGYVAATATSGLRTYLADAPAAAGAVVVSAPLDRDDPAGQQQAAEQVLSPAVGSSALAGLPVLVEPAVVTPPTGTTGAQQATWTVIADPAAVRPADIPALIDGLAALPAAVAAGDLGARATVTGDLGETLDTVQRSGQAADAVSSVPMLLVAAISLVMLIQLSKLLALDRRAETALIRSRGASAGQLIRIAAIEAAAMVLPAALLGAAAALALLALIGGGFGAAWLVAAVTAAVAVVVIVAPAAHQARRPANRQEIDNSGRTTSLAAGTTVVLVVAAAVVALVRFRRNGSALIIDADGTAHVDPIAALAPALVLIAAALIAALVFEVSALAVQRLAARVRRGHGTVLAARQVARRGVLFGVAVLMTSLAVGGTGLAAGFSATQAKAQELTDDLRNGAPIRVVLPPEDPAIPRPYSSPVAAIDALPGVGTARATMRTSAALGALDVTLSGVDSGDLATFVPATDSFDPAAVGAAIAVAPDGAPIPAGATALQLPFDLAAAWRMPPEVSYSDDGERIVGDPPSGPADVVSDLGVVVWIADPGGAARPVRAGSLAVPIAPEGGGTPTTAVLDVPLPGLLPGSRLIAIDVANRFGDPAMATRLTVGEATAQTPAGNQQVPLSTSWTVTPTAGGDSDEALRPVGDAVGWQGTFPANSQTTIRLAPDRAADAVLPVAISTAVADAAGFAVDDRITLALDGARSVPARIAAISPVLPGDADGLEVLADLDDLTAALLHATNDLPAPGEIRIAPEPGATTEAVAGAVRSVVPEPAVVQAAGSRSAQALLRPAAAALWVGAAGALLLAAVGTGCVIAILARERAGEAVVLRAVGVTATGQARSRRRELFSVSAAGWVLGVVVAAVAVLTCVSGLAGSAVVDLVPGTASIAVDVPVALAMLGVNVLVVGLLIVVHGRHLRSAVATAIPSGAGR